MYYCKFAFLASPKVGRVRHNFFAMNVTLVNFTTFCSWTFFNSHWLHVYDRPDIYWGNLSTILTVEKKVSFRKYFSWYFFNCHIVSWRSSAVHKMAKTKSALDKLVRFLKVESIYNYPILQEYNSINRWRHWKTRDLGVWH